MMDEELLKVTVSYGIDCCDNNVLNLSSLRELIDCVLVDQIHPVLPLVLLGEVDIVVDETTIEGTWQDLLFELDFHGVKLAIADLLELLIEWSAELGVN